MNVNTTALFSLVIATSVFLSGLHAKELPALSATASLRHQANVRKAAKDDTGSNSPHSKVSGEVHNHIEKQTLKSALKTFSDPGLQADARHLKRQRHHARRTAQPKRLNDVLSLVGGRALAMLSA